MTTYSLDAQIAEVEHEIRMRKDVYGRQCNAGKMRRSIADYRIACMEAVLKTLQEARKHESR